MSKNALFFFILSLTIIGCQSNDEIEIPMEDIPFVVSLPFGFPMPDVPEENYLTEARVALGKRLFYDPILSLDSTISCNSCHLQEFAFADNRQFSPGIEGRLGFRNSPSLANVTFLSEVNKDGGVPKLELQALVPIEDEFEMDLRIQEAVTRLQRHPYYSEQALKAYGRPVDAFVITRSLAAFLRTMISGRSKYDEYLEGLVALTALEERGRQLFFSAKTNCSNCHSGFNFTNNQFENNGTYDVYEDLGRQRVTILASDIGKFRVPSLRNITLTAPYMHDGNIANLEAVIAHYNNGGTDHPNKNPLIRPLQLTDEEQLALVAFLNTLTDPYFVVDPTFQKDE